MIPSLLAVVFYSVHCHNSHVDKVDGVDDHNEGDCYVSQCPLLTNSEEKWSSRADESGQCVDSHYEKRLIDQLQDVENILNVREVLSDVNQVDRLDE